jgi:hypothetical protein
MHLPRSEITALYDHEMPREPGWREGPNLERQSDYAWALEHFGHASELMDPGIIRVVRIFTEHKIETCQSCQGGEGHAYTRPSVDLTYQPWEALGVASHYGIPVTRISHIWNVDPDSDEPRDSPIWRIEFRPDRLSRLRDRWYDEEEADRQEYAAWLAAHEEHPDA